MTPATELAWAAGFFDGEGSISLSRTGPVSANVWHVLRLDANQIDRRPLDRFARAVGVGAVRGPYTHGRDTKRHRFMFVVQNYDDVATVLLALWPYLSEPKREQAMRVLDVFLAEREATCAGCQRRIYRRRSDQLFCTLRCGARVRANRHNARLRAAA